MKPLYKETRNQGQSWVHEQIFKLLGRKVRSECHAFPSPLCSDFNSYISL